MITQDVAVSLFASIAGTQRPDILLPAGTDDCGAIMIDARRALVVTTDFTNFAPHAGTFNIGSVYDWARLLVWHNVSDLLGSGTEPLCLVAAIGVPITFTEEDILNLARGLRDGSSEARIALLGGDTKQSPNLTLCATAFGISPKGSLWRRDAGRPGDDVYVSGAVGGVSAAVYLVMANPSRRHTNLSQIEEALLRPKLPFTVFDAVRSKKVRAAALDISDGLGADLLRLAEASQTGIEIDGSKIPCQTIARSVAAADEISPLEFAFGLGGDLQFCFATARRYRKAIEDTGAVRIGRLTKTKSAYLLLRNRRIDMPDFGHSDFTAVSSRQRFLALIGKRGL